MAKSKTYDRDAEIETLQLLFEKLAKRIQPNHYCEVKIVIADGKLVDTWIMDKAKTRDQIQAF